MAPVAGAAAAVPLVPHLQQSWEDSPAEVTVTFRLGAGPFGKADVDFRVQRRHLRVSFHGVVACDGELYGAVDPSDCFWCLEQETSKTDEAAPCRMLVATLAKAVAKKPWPYLWKADEEAAEGDQPSKPSVVIGSSWDLGEEEASENVEEQRLREREFEPRYLELLREKGLEHEETLAAFFRLFQEKIQLYKLSELEAYLKDVVPVCRRRTDSFRIQAIQALATVRFKQSRVREGLDLLLEMEELVGTTNAALSENIALGLSELGDLEGAEKRFRGAMRLHEVAGTPARGSTLLGLSNVYLNMGKVKEALPVAQQANEYYLRIANGRPSSMQAKCAATLGRVLAALGELEPAAKHLRQAVSAYAVTCGEESPLIGTALQMLGPILMQLGQIEEAKAAFKRAYELEVIKDAWDFSSVVGLHMQLMMAHTAGTDMVEREEFKEYFGLVDRAVARARSVSEPGLPIMLKCAAEVKAYGADYAGAVALLEEALPCFRAGATLGDQSSASAVPVTEKLLRLCNECHRRERTPPMQLNAEDVEYGLLTPPTRKAAERVFAQRMARSLAAARALQEEATSSLGPVIEELPVEPAGGASSSASSSSLPTSASCAGAGTEPPACSPAAEALAISEQPLLARPESQKSCKAKAAIPKTTRPELALQFREMRARDFEAIERLWAARGAERLFASEELLSRHLEANKGLSFVAERGGEVCGLSVAGAAGPFGVVRQVVSHHQTLRCKTEPPAAASPLALALAQQVMEELVDRTASALRSAGCTSVEVLVPLGDPQRFWEGRARGPVRSVYTI